MTSAARADCGKPRKLSHAGASIRIVEDGIAQFDIIVFAAQRIMRMDDFTDALAPALDEAEPDPLVECRRENTR